MSKTDLMSARSWLRWSSLGRCLIALVMLVASLTIAPVQTASAETPEPRVGGTLRTVGLDPTTLDPHLVSDARSSEYVLEIFSGLVTIDPSLRIVPDLAESWEVSADGSVYTFTLVPGAVFHDGRPVTAEDVKYSIERAADPATGSPVVDTYLGDIVGVREKLAGEVEEVFGVQVLDERTVEITIEQPRIDFLAKLTYPTAFVVDRFAVETGPGWWLGNANGTGPFKLVVYEPGFGMLLTRNELYYRTPAYVDEVVFDLRGGSWLSRYEADVIDFVPSIFASEADDVFDPAGPFWDDLVSDGNGNPGVYQMSVMYIGFNTQQAPFDDPLVRKAFSHAVDKHLLNETIGRNLNIVANGILPPPVPGHDQTLRGLEFDPALARRLLAQSRYADRLPEVRLTVAGAGGPPSPYIAGLVDQWRRNLGVEVEVEQVDWVSFLEDTRAGRPQLFELGWVADYPDPQNFLEVLFHSASEENYVGYSNPEVDQLLEVARGEPDVATRIGLYQQAERLIVEDAAWLPLFFERDFPLVKPWVHDLHFSGMRVPRLQYVWLDP